MAVAPAAGDVEKQLNDSAVIQKAPAAAMEEAAASSTKLSDRPESFHSAESSFEDAEETPASSAKVSDKEEEEEEFKIPTDRPLSVPIPRPGPKQKPLPAAKLTGEQESKYATVYSKVSAWKTLPATTAKGAPQVAITEDERMWLTRECLLRYLRATKWNTANALRRLQSTLSWRREYGADKFTFEYISPENETGKQVILGFDNDARPCLYLDPAKQNTDMSDRQIHHLCFMLDRTIDMMPPNVENAVLLINFRGASSGKVPTMGQARQVLNILQNHNPERLGKALISQLPWYVNTFFKLISPFIDPVTREKMNFNKNLRDFIPPSTLWNHHDGDLNFVYDHSQYWPALEQEVKKRRDGAKERWIKGGSRIGEYEEYLKGGNKMSLQQEIDSYSGTPMPGSTPMDSEVDLVAKSVAKMDVKT